MDLNACMLQHFREAEYKVETVASTETSERQVWMMALKAMCREVIEGCAIIADDGGAIVVADQIRGLARQVG